MLILRFTFLIKTDYIIIYHIVGIPTSRRNYYHPLVSVSAATPVSVSITSKHHFYRILPVSLELMLIIRISVSQQNNNNSGVPSS